ncbi:hypothetical protein GJAV_G00181680 [Gymnothorax javanicus]|nr:hypothetical protein GJAV_G00181680 [Gymnothorax javanicus]
MQKMATRGLKNISCLLLLALLLASCPWGTTGRQLHLGTCVISVHTHELKNYFNEIRHSVQTEDNHMGLRLLKSHTMKDVKPAESCCFLRKLLRFYVEKVFSNYPAGEAHVRSCTSNLANSFLSIKKDLRHCHEHKKCHCDDHTSDKFESILASFEKLNQKEATVKAMGELDSLLDWMDESHQLRQHQ